MGNLKKQHPKRQTDKIYQPHIGFHLSQMSRVRNIHAQIQQSDAGQGGIGWMTCKRLTDRPCRRGPTDEGSASTTPPAVENELNCPGIAHARDYTGCFEDYYL